MLRPEGICPLTLEDQVPGEDTYAIRAVNKVGTSASASSQLVEIVSAPAPDAPMTRGYGAGQQVAVLFTAGAANGATVTGYETSVEGGPWLASSSVLSGNQAMLGGAARLRGQQLRRHLEPDATGDL